jgi:hypothetical protein
MKKKFLIIFVLFICSFKAFTQNFTYKGLNIFVDTHYANAILGSQSTVGQPLNTSVSVIGKPNIGMSVEAVFSLTKNLNLNVGLGANTFYFKQKIKGLTWESDLDPQVGFRPSITYFDSRLIAVNVPLKLNYVLNKNQGIELGLTTTVRFNKKSDFYTIRNDDNLKKIVSENSEILVRNVNFILSGGYNFKFKVKDKVNFLIQPYAAIHILGDELKLFYVNNYFYQVGINLGLELQQNNVSTRSKLKRNKIGG